MNEQSSEWAPGKEPEGWLVPPAPVVLHGGEIFKGLDESVQSFWRFALGDLRMNNARGYLAEFLVASALGIEDARRVEWDAWDLDWDGIKIEVKSSAYLQSWSQRRHSTITFSGLRGTKWDPVAGEDPAGRLYNADVYVFCVQTAKDHESYDQFSVAQWGFYVVPKTALEKLGYQSVGLATVQRISRGVVAFDALKDAVRSAVASGSTTETPRGEES
jgi:hypothetical protein